MCMLVQYNTKSMNVIYMGNIFTNTTWLHSTYIEIKKKILNNQ